MALRAAGQATEAEALFRKSLDLFQRKELTSHAKYAELLSEFGGLLAASGRADEARPLLAAAEARARKSADVAVGRP
jgi:tetratricopeptide (TPR) repeat protein